MSKHTPGPWIRYDYRVFKEGEGGLVFVAQTAWNKKTRTPAAEANAHLIAAAPELYEACREFVRKVENGEARSKRSYAQMSAAIAKAEGRTDAHLRCAG